MQLVLPNLGYPLFERPFPSHESACQPKDLRDEPLAAYLSIRIPERISFINAVRESLAFIRFSWAVTTTFEAR